MVGYYEIQDKSVILYHARIMHAIKDVILFTKFVRNTLLHSFVADSFNLLVNNGVAAGQVVFHVSCLDIKITSIDCLFYWVFLNFVMEQLVFEFTDTSPHNPSKKR